MINVGKIAAFTAYTGIVATTSFFIGVIGSYAVIKMDVHMFHPECDDIIDDSINKAHTRNSR